ncbi:MAG: hypothetical protein BIFFINMI_02321 [Phycisphaerae bacterium]|nr:hypothetical protein [Phycisphaerae bacterium]
MSRCRGLAGLCGLILLTLGGCRAATLGLGEVSARTGDGLALRFDAGGRVVAVAMDEAELPGNFASLLLPGPLAPGGFYLRDANQPLRQGLLGRATPINGGVGLSGSLGGLNFSATITQHGPCLLVDGRLTHPAGTPRGVTVGLTLPVNAAGWQFGQSISRTRTMNGPGPYAEWTCADADWDGRQINRGMFTPIFNEKVGLAMGAASDHPEIFRVSYLPGEGLSIEADLGLSPLPQKFPNTATFRFVIFRFDPHEGYRSALARYYELFPQDTKVRVTRWGNWYAGAYLRDVKDAHARDYAVVFASHGARDFAASIKEGVYIFEYSRGHYNVVPTWCKPGAPVDEIRRAVRFFWTVQSGDSAEGWKREPAPATLARMFENCYTTGPDGQMRTWTMEGPYRYQPRLYPDGYWAVGVPIDPDPELAEPNQAQRVLNWNFGVPLTEAATGTILPNLPGDKPDAPPPGQKRTFRLDGHHFDSWTEFAGRTLENYRPEHLRVVDYPLTFSYATGQPVQYHAFMWQELVRPLAEYLHSRDMLLFVNARPWRQSVMFDQALLDVFGGAERPERDIDAMAFMRSLVGNKPISGTGIGQDDLDPRRDYSPRELAQFERDLNILLPYCWFPGGFGPQELWQKYCFLMQEMAAAAWQPMTHAIVAHPDLLVERYGDGRAGGGKVFYAVHNRSERAVVYEMAIDLSPLGMAPGPVCATERLSARRPEASLVGRTLVLRSPLGARRTDVFELSRQGSPVARDTELKLETTPTVSAVTPLPPPDAARYAGPALEALRHRLGDLRPATLDRFIEAYEKEKRELGPAVAWHISRELADHPQWKSDAAALNAAAADIANWLAPRFDGFYEAVLPGPAMTRFAVARGSYAQPQVWRMQASARLVGDRVEVRLCDPLIESAAAGAQ